MTTALTAAQSGIAEFKSGVDMLLEKRRYFGSRILPLLVEGKDFYTIKGRKSLAKGGAEKIASIFGYTASFKRDSETLDSLKNQDWVAFVCMLSRDGKIIGEGRGAASVKNNGGDINKAVKMSLKSSYIDSVIRSTSLSDIFTQDIHEMPASSILSSTAVMSAEESEASLADDHYSNNELAENEEAEAYLSQVPTESVPASEKQISYLRDLARQNLDEGAEKDQYMANIESLSRSDCSEAIKGMLILARR